MRKIHLFAAVLLQLGVTSAHADLLFRDYEIAKKDPNWNSYLVGFARGAIYTNSLVSAIGQRQIFCLPRSFRVDAEVIFSVVDTHVKKVKPKPDEFVEQLILDSFVRAYPCLN